MKTRAPRRLVQQIWPAAPFGSTAEQALLARWHFPAALAQTAAHSMAPRGGYFPPPPTPLSTAKEACSPGLSNEAIKLTEREGAWLHSTPLLLVDEKGLKSCSVM